MSFDANIIKLPNRVNNLDMNSWPRVFYTAEMRIEQTKTKDSCLHGVEANFSATNEQSHGASGQPSWLFLMPRVRFGKCVFKIKISTATMTWLVCRIYNYGPPRISIYVYVYIDPIYDHMHENNISAHLRRPSLNTVLCQE